MSDGALSDASRDGGRAEALRRVFRRITAVGTGALLLALTGVTLVDVGGRYLFNAPLPGASEMTELLVMAIVFTGLPAICLDDGHIAVDLFTSRLRGRAAVVQTVVARIVVAGMLALVAWQLWAHAERIGAWNAMTVYLRMPLAPVAYGASLVAGACALIVLAMAVARVPRGRSEEI